MFFAHDRKFDRKVITCQANIVRFVNEVRCILLIVHVLCT